MNGRLSHSLKLNEDKNWVKRTYISSLGHVGYRHTILGLLQLGIDIFRRLHLIYLFIYLFISLFIYLLIYLFIFQITVYLVERYSAYVTRDVLYGDATFTETYQSYARVPCLYLVLIIRKYSPISQLNVSFCCCKGTLLIKSGNSSIDLNYAPSSLTFKFSSLLDLEEEGEDFINKTE